LGEKIKCQENVATDAPFLREDYSSVHNWQISLSVAAQPLDFASKVLNEISRQCFNFLPSGANSAFALFRSMCNFKDTRDLFPRFAERKILRVCIDLALCALRVFEPPRYNQPLERKKYSHGAPALSCSAQLTRQALFIAAPIRV
jgi:hypothetical protein